MNGRSLFTIHISITHLLALGGLILACWLAFLLRDVLLLLAVAALLAVLMQPPLSWLAARGLPRGLGVLLLYLVFFVLLGLSLYALVPPLHAQIKELAGGAWLPGGWLDQWLAQWQRIAERSPLLPPLLDLPARLGATLELWAATLARWAVGLSGALLDGILVLTIAYFLAVDCDSVGNVLLRLLPARYRQAVEQVARAVAGQLGRWVWSQALLCLFIAVTFGVGLSLLGVPYAPLLALIGGVLEVVPYLGTTLTVLAAVAISLPQSAGMALGAVLCYLLVNTIENYVVIPYLYRRTMRLHPLLVLVAYLVGGRLLGLSGLLLAVPLAAIVQAVWEYEASVREEKLLTAADGAPDHQPSFRSRGAREEQAMSHGTS